MTDHPVGCIAREEVVSSPTVAETLSRATFDELLWHLRGRRVCVLTGAGLSTDSGIPDYRGPQGSLKTRTPVRYNEFVRSAEDRRRYWARSYVGWSFMRSRAPNDGHHAVTKLQRSGVVSNIVTQNVDGLHQRAGAQGVIELHGGLNRVICLACGATSSRESLQDRMGSLNPGWETRRAEEAPDGDAEISYDITQEFHVPDCERCGGMLKPDVVFFGESVPKDRVATVFDHVERTDLLLVVGSSLTVYSGFRFADFAVKRGKPLVVINAGPTRADEITSLKINAPIADVLPRLATTLAPPHVRRRDVETTQPPGTQRR